MSRRDADELRRDTAAAERVRDLIRRRAELPLTADEILALDRAASALGAVGRVRAKLAETPAPTIWKPSIHRALDVTA